MQFTFDLISDLHVETWDDFDWTHQATSPYCVVAGDVSKDRKLLAETLKHLGECYQGVFFIDGNDEHRDSLDNLGQSYKDLRRYVDKFKNVVFMQDNVVVVNGVAFLAVNGWWSFDLDPTISQEQTVDWFHARYGVSDNVAPQITSMALNDAAYLHHSIKKLQTHQDVKSIVIVSHTVPSASLINHDLELEGHYRLNIHRGRAQGCRRRGFSAGHRLGGPQVRPLAPRRRRPQNAHASRMCRHMPQLLFRLGCAPRPSHRR